MTPTEVHRLWKLSAVFTVLKVLPAGVLRKLMPLATVCLVAVFVVIEVSRAFICATAEFLRK